MFQLRYMNKTDSPEAANSAACTTQVPGRSVVLLQEPEILIAEDIIGSLRTSAACRVIHVTDADQVAAAFSAEPAISLILLAMSFADVRAAAFYGPLVAAGTPVVLTAVSRDEAEIRRAGWGLLRRPFSDQMLREELALSGATPRLPDA